MPKSTILGMSAPFSAVIDDDVVGLEVAVDDALAVRGREGARDGQERLHGDGRGEALLAAEDGAERLAVEQLHDDEGVALIGLAEVEDAHDRGVHQAGGGARLGEQAVAGAGGRAIAADELDGDVDVERDVVRLPDGAHAARGR